VLATKAERDVPRGIMNTLIRFAAPIGAAAIVAASVAALVAAPASAGTHATAAKPSAALPVGTQPYPLEIIVGGATIPLLSYKFDLAKTSTGRAKNGDMVVRMDNGTNTPALFADFVDNKDLGKVRVQSSVVGAGDFNYTTSAYTLTKSEFVADDYSGTNSLNSDVNALSLKYMNVSVSYTSPPPVS
jgi:hypothetical protein